MNKRKIGKFLKATFNFLVKVGIATAGATAFTNPLSASIAGGTAIASAISAAVKDKKFKPAMKVINVIACNIDKARNDYTKNK